MRKIQDANVKKKEEAKQKLKEKSMEGIRRKQAMVPYSQNEGEEEKDDDDAEYYRKEVGKEPEKGILKNNIWSPSLYYFWLIVHRFIILFLNPYLNQLSCAFRFVRSGYQKQKVFTIGSGCQAG